MTFEDSLPIQDPHPDLEENNRILVIDDNRAIHEDIRKILSPAYNSALADAEALLFPEIARTPPPRVFEIEQAYQGLDGIEQFRCAMEEGRAPAVTFLDVRMPPGIDGLETAVRLLEMSSELQIVLCTAHSDYSWEEMSAKLGRTDRVLLLKKPFCAVEVQQIVHALTAKWALSRQARRTAAEVDALVQARTLELTAANERLQAEIAQRLAAEEHLLRAQRLESIGALASGIAHDMNNLLSPIRMGTELLKMSELADRDLQIVTSMETAATRAAQLISRMLMFARGSDEKRDLLETGGLVREVSKMAHETFPPNITIETHVASGLNLLHGNVTQLHQVLMNLCVNARDAMPEGGRIRLQADNFVADESFAAMEPEAKPGKYVVLTVADTGSGIPAEIRDKIFDPFFSTKAPGKGTGLGLSTVAGIVRSHGGFLQLQSTAGDGTRFSVYLPAAEGCAEANDPVDSSLPPCGRGEMVLVVDDEESIRGATAALLEASNYAPVTAADGVEALQLLVRHRGEIKAIVSDMLMPLIDGRTLARIVRQMEPSLPVIIVSGSDEFTPAELKTLKITGPLSKPFRSRELLDALHRVLHATP